MLTRPHEEEKEEEYNCAVKRRERKRERMCV